MMSASKDLQNASEALITLNISTCLMQPHSIYRICSCILRLAYNSTSVILKLKIRNRLHPCVYPVLPSFIIPRWSSSFLPGKLKLILSLSPRTGPPPPPGSTSPLRETGFIARRLSRPQNGKCRAGLSIFPTVLPLIPTLNCPCVTLDCDVVALKPHPVVQYSYSIIVVPYYLSKSQWRTYI